MWAHDCGVVGGVSGDRVFFCLPNGLWLAFIVFWCSRDGVMCTDLAPPCLSAHGGAGPDPFGRVTTLLCRPISGLMPAPVSLLFPLRL